MSQIGFERDRAKRRAEQRFQAKYPGRCVACDDEIEVGDLLRWDDDVAVHAGCDAKNPMPELQRETCPKCWTEIAVSGDCAC